MNPQRVVPHAENVSKVLASVKTIGATFMGFFSIHILLVDDYERWRRFVRELVQTEPQLQVIAEASDGSEAVQKVSELHPDLIVLDIGLPGLNGIEAARRMQLASPNSKILFFSENRSVEIVEEAMRSGARGFVLKSDAANHLRCAIRNVLAGERFLSSSLAEHLVETSGATSERLGLQI